MHFEQGLMHDVESIDCDETEDGSDNMQKEFEGHLCLKDFIYLIKSFEYNRTVLRLK